MEARRDLTNHARSLALGTVDSAAPIPVATDAFSDDALNRSSSGPTPLATRHDDPAVAELGEDATTTTVDVDIDDGDENIDDEATLRGRPAESPTRPTHRRSSSAPGKWSHGGSRRVVGGGGGRGSRFGEEQFMRAEWMVDIPADLASAWCVVPRPEGDRALVISSRGTTTSRGKTGRVLHRFQSALPGGSSSTRHGDAFCILDCVFHRRDQTYYAMDCLAWNGMSMYDCAAEMRLSWLHAKLGDPETAECAAAGPPGPNNKYTFAVPPAMPCDANGLGRAYADEVGFARDGLMFLAKDGNYELGTTPLAMLWKDPRCSAHFLDENPGLSDSGRQRVVLALRAETGDVVTGDAHPAALARLPPQFIASADGGDGGGLRDGVLIRFAVGDGGFDVRDGVIVAADLMYEGLANQRRGYGADSATKILFQYYARREPITAKEICDAVTEQAYAGASRPGIGEGADERMYC